jgi:formyltetrahydrofolate-dependent phosphoribosylglycinamide formyltransferase
MEFGHFERQAKSGFISLPFRPLALNSVFSYNNRGTEMTKIDRKKIAILISGNGTNMAAILNAQKNGNLNADIPLVICDNANAPGVGKARDLGCETLVTPYAKGVSREENERRIVDAIIEHDIDFIVLAGFMRILSASFVRKFSGRIINIHPSMLPSFPGAHAIKDAFEAGVEFTGVTVHVVDEQVDHGPIIAQEKVAILPGDSEESLAERIHAAEHRLYPEVLRHILSSEG